MLYSEFVKNEMAKLKSSDMKASEKMKIIAQLWKKSKQPQEMKAMNTTKKEPHDMKAMKMNTSKNKKSSQDDILEMMGVKPNKPKTKPKSKIAESKIIKAMEKMSIPMKDTMDDKKTHPTHLMTEKNEKKIFDLEDNEIGF